MNPYDLNILLVEDNPGDVELIKIYLKEGIVKHRLFQAVSLGDAFEIIRDNDIHLALLDLSLTDSSGFKTLSTFIDKCPQVPTVVLTGYNNEIVGNQAIKAGAQDFLIKGQIEAKTLGRTIRYALQRHRTQLRLEEAFKSIAQSEKRYAEAQEMAHFGNWVLDIIKGDMTWTDEVFRILGYIPQSISPTMSDYLRYVHREEKNDVESFLENAAKDGQLHKMEHRIMVGHTQKHIALQARVNYDEVTEKLQLVGSIQDITERKVNEQLLAEKNISKGTSKVRESVLADTSFLIRTPLSSVVNLLYLLENTGLNLQQRELYDNLKISVEDLSLMINNLLNFSVLVSDNIKVESSEVQIKELLQGVYKTFQLKLQESKTEVKLIYPEIVAQKIFSDGQKITLVLHNLIENAIKFSPQGGTVQVTANLQPFDETTAQLFLQVEDNGVGMSTQKIKSLLDVEKMLSTNNEQVEVGKSQPLGLAIVVKLLQLISGKIVVDSTEGKGSIFTVTIPVKIKQKREEGKLQLDRPLRILLVEDHFLNQMATKKILTNWSKFVTVDVADNGEIGVAKFEKQLYDVILMDIQMPKMDGIEASKIIRKSSTVPIIALTANTSKQEAERCYTAGINDYLAKPFKPDELFEHILTVL
jgi:CheY-like chemotaxis protein